MSAPAPRMNGYKWAITAMIVVIVALIGVIAQMQMQRGGPGAVPAPQPTETGAQTQSPAATVETSEGKTEEQRRLEAFLVDELPRRQEGDPLSMGAVDAPVVMTEWSDFRCPFCSVFAEQTLPGLQRFIDDGTLRVEFRDLAIFGDESIKAATAARAAGEQGKYAEFAHGLFAALPDEGHPDVPDELVHQIVTELGLDLEQFKADWADPAHKEAVLADTAEAQQLGLSSTPSFVVGAQFVAGAQPLDQFVALIEQQAAQLS